MTDHPISIKHYCEIGGTGGPAGARGGPDEAAVTGFAAGAGVGAGPISTVSGRAAPSDGG